MFPGTGTKRFGPITIGFIGMTLKETRNLVTPSGVKGLSFADEAATANALVPELKAEGADAIVAADPPGRTVTTVTTGQSAATAFPATCCRSSPSSIGDQLVVSGHTHWAYVCNGDGRRREGG